MQLTNERDLSRHSQAVISILCCVILSSLQGTLWAEGKLKTGEPLPIGTDSGNGDFALPSISCSPLGAASVFGRERPDLFVVSDKWHPGLSLHRWLGDNESGVPIFSQPIEIEPLEPELASADGYLMSDNKNQVFGFWLKGDKLLVAQFDKSSNSFRRIKKITIEGLPRNPGKVAVKLVDGKRLEGFLSVGDGVVHKPGHHRDENYTPYDGAGIWRGGLPREGIYRFTCDWPKLPKEISATEILPTEKGGLLGINSMEWIDTPGQDDAALLFGTKLGGLYFVSHAFDKSNDSNKTDVLPVTGVDGSVIRHPTVGTNIVAYPSKDGARVDLIVAGEGGIYYYQSAQESSPDGAPVFGAPERVQQKSPHLYSGSLVVPNVVDWNGDNKLDIVAGNSAGRLLFFANHGTNSEPRFQPAEYIESAGEPVLIQGGYRGSIQGPGEAHWGYTCPHVVDWNQDGLLDIVMNDIRGIHTLYLNEGTPTEPKLGLPRELIMDSLEMHGTWRTRPTAGLLGDRMAYITLDDDDQIHLFWRIDNHTLKDGGKILMQNGDPIQANHLPAGGTGRGKFQLVDWDKDGKVDLLVGTTRHSSFPEPKRGVPWSMDHGGSSVLLFKNLGTNEQPVYEYPAVMHVAGKPVHLGQHSCAPFASTLGSEDGETLNIVVGTEVGKMHFYRGNDIQWKIIR